MASCCDRTISFRIFERRRNRIVAPSSEEIKSIADLAHRYTPCIADLRQTLCAVCVHNAPSRKKTSLSLKDRRIVAIVRHLENSFSPNSKSNLVHPHTKKKTQHLSFIFYSRTYLIHSSSPASRFLLFTAIPRTTEHPRFEREKKKRGNLLRQIFRRTPIDLRSRTSLIDYARRYKITFVHRYFSTLFRFDRHSIFDRSTIRKRILRSFAQPIRKSLPFLPLLLFRYHQILDPVIVPFIFRKKIPRVIVVHRFVQIAYSKNSQFKIDHHHRKRDPSKCTVRWSLLISPLTVKTY